MLSLTTAFVATAFALVAKIVADQWNRHSDRRSIAGALAGEVSAYMKQLDPLKFANNFRKIAESDEISRRRCLRSLPKTPSGHPVFDKVADKIGLLPAAEAEEISSFYNVITGFRVLVSGLSDDRFVTADGEVQIALLNTIADKICEETTNVPELIDRLREISTQTFWQSLRSREESRPRTLTK